MCNRIQIRVKLIGTFRIDRFAEQKSEYPQGISAAEIMTQLQLSQRALGVVLINGLHARVDDTLNEGDTLTLLPIMGGG